MNFFLQIEEVLITLPELFDKLPELIIQVLVVVHVTLQGPNLAQQRRIENIGQVFDFPLHQIFKIDLEQGPAHVNGVIFGVLEHSMESGDIGHLDLRIFHFFRFQEVSLDHKSESLSL